MSEREKSRFPFDIEDIMLMVALALISIGSFLMSISSGFIITGFTIIGWLVFTNITKIFLLMNDKRRKT